MSIASRTFGALVPAAELEAEATIARGDDVVRLDLNVAAAAAVTRATIDEVDAAVAELDAIDALARAEFARLLDDEDAQPIQFWQFHRDDVEGFAHVTRERFVATLQLVRAGFYPDGQYDASWLVLDYKLRGPESDQLLVVHLRKDRSIETVSWES